MQPASTYIPDTSSEYMNISQISHEIRNPLTLINCTIQLLDVRYPQLHGDDLWQQLSEDVNYLRQLTVSLSDLNKSSQTNFSAVNIQQLLNGLASQYLILAQNQNKHLSVLISDELPIIICDEIKIRQALINLIKNAFEATSDGDTIEISTKSTAKRLLISVRDTGKGIPQDQISHIFKPFATDKKDGTGLGLAITQKIAAAHKGSIQVYSKEGIGSKFTLSLPINQI